MEGRTFTSRAADMGRSIDKIFCSKWIYQRVPLTHRQELYHILKMTGPLLLSRILNCLLPFVVTMFCGRLGNDVMAGYGLASATINVTTAATGYGLGLACDTLVSQTFGGKNLLRVGVILQRGIIILLLFCLPCWGLLINAQAILLCLGQDPEVARIAHLYIAAFLPAVPAMFLHHLQVSYLQNQGIIMPQMYTAAMANIANVVTNYIFLHWMDLGINGSAAANTLSQIYICAFLFAYIWWKKLHTKTWGGWSVESLQEWGSYMKLAIPSSLMKCFEWKIIGLMSHLMNVYCFLQFFDGLVCVCTGIFVGTGKQRIPAVANLIGYYGIGLSLSVTLMFVAKLRVLGFWLGLLICVILQSTFFIIVIFRLNWERMTEEAVRRAQKNTHMTSSNTAELSDALNNTVNAAYQTANNVNSVDAYMSMRIDSSETQGGHVEVQQLDGGHLSITQLILRRGLTMFVAVVLLAVGASVHFLVPLPETLSTESNFTIDSINTTYTPADIYSTVLVSNNESD